jgi:hypothetical protein
VSNGKTVSCDTHRDVGVVDVPAYLIDALPTAVSVHVKALAPALFFVQHIMAILCHGQPVAFRVIDLDPAWMLCDVPPL